jgi:hypothetical protein
LTTKSGESINQQFENSKSKEETYNQNTLKKKKKNQNPQNPKNPEPQIKQKTTQEGHLPKRKEKSATSLW